MPVKPVRKRREDYEYVREVHCALFMRFESQQQFRHVEARPQLAARDYADILKLLADEIYPDATKIRQDNLNTHIPAALYQRFEPAEARSLTQRFEFHACSGGLILCRSERQKLKPGPKTAMPESKASLGVSRQKMREESENAFMQRIKLVDQ